MDKHLQKVFFLCIIFMLSTTLIGVPHLYAQGQKFSEYQVKAAFLYNFAKFIEWPSESPSDNSTPLILFVLGEDPFGTALDEIEGKIIRGEKLAIKRTNTIKHLKDCHILFISASEENHLVQIIEALKGSNVLTIGDSNGFAQRGVMINFYTEQNKIRFEINLEAAKRAGLNISSNLLKLSKIVHAAQ